MGFANTLLIVLGYQCITRLVLVCMFLGVFRFTENIKFVLKAILYGKRQNKKSNYRNVEILWPKTTTKNAEKKCRW